MYQSTLEGRFIEVDPLFAEMLGYGSPREMVDCIRDIGAQLYVEQGVRGRLLEQLVRDGGISNFESQVYRKDGERLWVAEYCRAVRGGDGRIAHFQGAFVDISPYKELQAEEPAAPRPARSRRVPVKDGTRVRFMEAAKIVFIRADGDYVHVHSDGGGHVMARDRIGSLIQRLDAAEFVRISKSAVVNLNYVREMRSRRHGSYEFVMDDGAQLASGPTYGEVVRKLLEALG